MARICEACGLKSPDSAVVCDCGYQLRAVDARTLAAAQLASHEVRSRSPAIYIAGAVAAALVAWKVVAILLRSP